MPDPDRLQLRVDDDGQAAWLRVEAGAPSGREAADGRLAAAGVVAGIDEEALTCVARMLALPEPGDAAICVARGRPATEATPDALELVEPIGPLAGTLREDERFDFRERRLIVPLKAGDPVGRIVRGAAGLPGFDVLGRPLEPKPAAPLSLLHGDGIACDDAGVLRATRDGARTVDRRGVLDVVALHVHGAPVDLASGNLETEGSLQIRGDVASAMHVRAGADLAIRGTVDDARVEAGGSIEISGGVIGGETGRVRAGGDLALKHAQRARLDAGGRLRVARSVAGGRLRAREIEIGGTFLGDVAEAETRISVGDAGSANGAPCRLRAAHPLEEAEREPADPQAARERALARLRAPVETLAARKSRDSRKGRGERPDAPDAALLERQRAFRQRERELQPLARIEIRGVAHEGCRIDFGGRPLVLEQSVRRRVFRFDPERDEIVAEEP